MPQGWLQVMALLRPPLTPKKGIEGVVFGVPTVWALRAPHLPHFMEVRVKEPVSRQLLCEVVVHLTMPTMEPRGQLASKVRRPSSVRILNLASSQGA